MKFVVGVVVLVARLRSVEATCHNNWKGGFNLTSLVDTIRSVTNFTFAPDEDLLKGCAWLEGRDDNDPVLLAIICNDTTVIDPNSNETISEICPATCGLCDRTACRDLTGPEYPTPFKFPQPTLPGGNVPKYPGLNSCHKLQVPGTRDRLSKHGDPCSDPVIYSICQFSCSICTAAPTDSPTATFAPSASPTWTPAPSQSPAPSSTPTDSNMPTFTESPSSSPTVSPPVDIPIRPPTPPPTPAPTPEPTPSPTPEPTPAPMDAGAAASPAGTATPPPTPAPTPSPTTRPPTPQPTFRPTRSPTTQAPTTTAEFVHSEAWVNEFHYLDTKLLENRTQFVEVAYGTNSLAAEDFSMSVYDPGGSLVEPTIISTLSGCSGNGEICYESMELQFLPEAKGAICILYPFDGSTRTDFVSYGGTVTALSGDCAQQTSTDAGVEETSSTLHSTSIQLTGNGCRAEDFAWVAGRLSSPASGNWQQTINKGVCDSTPAPAASPATPASPKLSSFCDKYPSHNRVIGTPSDDTLIGTSGDDCIEGLEGNDIIEAKGGNNVVSGGAGADTIIFHYRKDYGSNTIYGDAGQDVISGGRGDDIIKGGDDNDDIDGGSGADVIYGDAGADTIQGYYGDDTIKGGDGDDSINGYEGDDVIYGDAGADTINGYYEDDTIKGGDGDDRIYGHIGADVIYGDAGADTIQGGDQDDTIKGGDDDDSIDGQDGADVIYGDAGADTIQGGPGPYKDTIKGDGDDSIDGNNNAVIYQ